MLKKYRLFTLPALVGLVAAQMASSVTEKALAADCDTKTATPVCNYSSASGNCSSGSECDTETPPNQTSTECGSSDVAMVLGALTCISADPHVINCDNGGTAYRATITFCYCLDDWGFKGTCTGNAVNVCQYGVAISHTC